MTDLGFYSLSLAPYLAGYSGVRTVLLAVSLRRQMIANNKHVAYSVFGFFKLTSNFQLAAIYPAAKKSPLLL